MENTYISYALSTLVILQILGVLYVVYKVYVNTKKNNDFRTMIKKGDIVRIQSRAYPTCRITNISDDKVIVSLIVPKEYIYPKDHNGIAEDFD
jgi:hypothetical protein